MVKETSEIVKLTERVSKDPKSKLFVPLAEEYKKAGDLEMAVYVLTEGLKHNPGYVTARSILGRLLLEQGDLLGSQRELEEVVKAIPDNLLAQRKLGDICILQNNPSEALRHYKLVLALNPRDNEVVAIISDIEAGRDVSQKIPQNKAKPVLGKAASLEVKPQPAVASAPPVQQARVGTPVLEPSAPVSHPEKPEALKIPASAPVAAPTAAEMTEPSAPQSEKTGAGASAAVPSAPVTQTEQTSVQKTPPAAGEALIAQKIEEPEEIFLVEPLEKEKSDQEPREAIPDFLSDQGLAAALLKGEPAELTSAFPDQSRQTPVSPELLVTEPDIFTELKTTGDELPAFEEKKTGAEIVDIKIDKEAAVSLPETTVESPTKKSDDFTTDTLAELYIAQGFFEKAIDIYERLFAENSNNKGLKDKLDRVKAMASAAVSAAEEEEKKASADIYAEPQVYSAQQEHAAEKKKTAFSGEPVEKAHSSKREEKTPAVSADAAAEFVSPQGQDITREKPFYTDFEPREYVPPEVKVEEKKAENVLTSPKSPATIRKETIHRLESWLKNIKKET